MGKKRIREKVPVKLKDGRTIMSYRWKTVDDKDFYKYYDKKNKRGTRRDFANEVSESRLNELEGNQNQEREVDERNYKKSSPESSADTFAKRAAEQVDKNLLGAEDIMNWFKE